ETFAYDAAANLLDGPQAGAGRVVHNKLLTYQDKRYRYDAFGRLIEKRSAARGLQRFAYDAESRLSEVRNENGSVVRMTYDPLGRRIAKTEHDTHGYPLGETRFTWDGLRLLQESRYNQTSLYLYTDNTYEPLARVDGYGAHQKVRYYHNDLNGLPEQLTEADGHSVWQARFEVWGNTLQETREAYFIEEQNLRFQGQYLDREIGLHYNVLRFYDPDVGRFTTPDPIGLAGGLNFYAYAPNPIGYADPLGLAVDPLIKLKERGYTGVTKTPGGGLDYSESNALYNKKPGVNPIVRIEYTGDYGKDFEAANKAAKLSQKTTPSGHVWHHLDDYDPKTNTGTMQLIKQSAHNGISHNGGVAQYKAATGKAYTHPARFKSRTKGASKCG
ncbi:RHS repeat-associated core domain-containing protein, partial [Pseudomonas sp. SMN5]|uniref:HNH endonuclease signature motif containing protein n=1 Tax=Pseudomonas sp. SMN5 TaxID=3390198 RepID=UPI003F872F8B